MPPQLTAARHLFSLPGRALPPNFISRTSAPDVVAGGSALARRRLSTGTTSDTYVPTPNSKHEKIVILGTGWGGFNLAKELTQSTTILGRLREILGLDPLHEKLDPHDLTVISPANHFVFTPLLPSTAVGTLEFRVIQEPIRNLGNIEYMQAKAKSVDFDRKVVKCEGTHTMMGRSEFEIPYDKLVISVGVKTNTFNTNNVAEFEGRNVWFLKHLHHARGIRLRTLELFEIANYPTTSEEERRRLLSFIIVGAGPTSCEYASELHDFVREDLRKFYPNLMQYLKITVVEAGDDILGPFDQSLRDYVKKLFKKRSIDIKTKTAVTSVYSYKIPGYQSQAAKAVLSDGTEMPYGLMIWSAGLEPVEFTKNLDSTDIIPSNRIERTPQGRIVVDEYLRVKGREGSVWAIGDCAQIDSKPLPQLAQVAQQQASYLAPILMNGKEWEAKQPWSYFTLGSMMSAGSFKGIYDGSVFGDPHGWHTKIMNLQGSSAWLAWRGAYWSRQVSWKNRILIPMYWMKAHIMGRDISKF